LPSRTRVGVGERELDETLPQRLLDDHVEQRQHAVMQAVLAQALHRLSAWPESSSFSISSNIRAGGTFSRAAPASGSALVFLDGQAKLRRQPRRAQHAHRVLAWRVTESPIRRMPARTSGRRRRSPTLLRWRIEIERVDREIAAQRILGLRAEHVVGKQPSVLVGRVVAGLARAEGRHFDGLGPASTFTSRKRRPMMKARAEQRLHLLGSGVGGDVEVLGRDAEQQVAHRTADHERLVPRLLQLADHVLRAARNCVRRTECAAGPYTRGSDEPCRESVVRAGGGSWERGKGEWDIPVIALGLRGRGTRRFGECVGASARPSDDISSALLCGAVEAGAGFRSDES
jgi:hypothetical protein